MRKVSFVIKPLAKHFVTFDEIHIMFSKEKVILFFQTYQQKI